jgi:phosphoglycolate phosphatase-like HAD superfamily hydrolase
VRTLVLWDIDLTLLDLRKLGGGWFQRAVQEVTGRELTTTPAFAGRTDRWIARQLLLDVGLAPTDDLIDRIHDVATRAAGEDRARMAEVGHVLPGVPEILRELAARPEVVQTLVTGNLKPIAGFKLDAFGLDKHVDLDIGGYGSTSEHRELLVAQALHAMRERYGDEPTATVVVGDTPHDVHAALAHDARAVGVTTGSFDADALATAGAHAILPDLADTDRAVAAILDGQPGN